MALWPPIWQRNIWPKTHIDIISPSVIMKEKEKGPTLMLLEICIDSLASARAARSALEGGLVDWE